MDNKLAEQQEQFCEFLGIYEVVVHFIGHQRARRNIYYFNSFLKLATIIVALTLCYSGLQNKSVELIGLSLAIAAFSTFSFMKLVKVKKILDDEFNATVSKFDSLSKNLTSWYRKNNNSSSYFAAIKLILDLKTNCFYSFIFRDFNELIMWNGIIYFSNAICLIACNWFEDCGDFSIVKILLIFELIVLISEYLFVTERTKRRTKSKNENLRNKFDSFTSKLEQLTTKYNRRDEHYIESKVDTKTSSENKTMLTELTFNDDSVERTGKTDEFIDSRALNDHTCLLSEDDEVNKQKIKHFDSLDITKIRQVEIEKDDSFGTTQNPHPSKDDAGCNSSSDGNEADENTEVSVSTQLSSANGRVGEKKNVHTDFTKKPELINTVMKDDAEAHETGVIEETSQNHTSLKDKAQCNFVLHGNLSEEHIGTSKAKKASSLETDEGSFNGNLNSSTGTKNSQTKALKDKCATEVLQNCDFGKDDEEYKLSSDEQKPEDPIVKSTNSSSENNEVKEQEDALKKKLSNNFDSSKNKQNINVKTDKDEHIEEIKLQKSDTGKDNNEQRLTSGINKGEEDVAESINSSFKSVERDEQQNMLQEKFSKNSDSDKIMENSQSKEGKFENIDEMDDSKDLKLVCDKNKGGEYVSESAYASSENIEVSEQENIFKEDFNQNFDSNKITKNSHAKREKNENADKTLQNHEPRTNNTECISTSDSHKSDKYIAESTISSSRNNEVNKQQNAFIQIFSSENDRSNKEVKSFSIEKDVTSSEEDKSFLFEKDGIIIEKDNNFSHENAREINKENKSFLTENTGISNEEETSFSNANGAMSNEEDKTFLYENHETSYEENESFSTESNALKNYKARSFSPETDGKSIEEDTSFSPENDSMIFFKN